MTTMTSQITIQPHDCLLNRLFRRRSKKTSKLRVIGLCVGNSPRPVNSPHKGPVTRKMFPFDDVIMFYRWAGAKPIPEPMMIHFEMDFVRLVVPQNATWLPLVLCTISAVLLLLWWTHPPFKSSIGKMLLQKNLGLRQRIQELTSASILDSSEVPSQLRRDRWKQSTVVMVIHAMWWCNIRKRRRTSEERWLNH